MIEKDGGEERAREKIPSLGSEERRMENEESMNKSVDIMKGKSRNGTEQKHSPPVISEGARSQSAMFSRALQKLSVWPHASVLVSVDWVQQEHLFSGMI